MLQVSIFFSFFGLLAHVFSIDECDSIALFFFLLLSISIDPLPFVLLSSFLSLNKQNKGVKREKEIMELRIQHS